MIVDRMGSGVAFSFVLIALCCHGYGAAPTVESTTEGKQATTTAGKLESKSGGISVRFGAYETNDDDILTFPGITNRAFGSFGSSKSSSPSSSGVSSDSSASSSSSSSSTSTKKVSVDAPQQIVRPDRPGRLQQFPSSPPCMSCCNSRPCGGNFPPTGGPFIPDQAFYLPPRPPQFLGRPDAFYPPSANNPFPGPSHSGSGSFSNSHASSSSSSGYNKFGNGYPQESNHINPGYQGGVFGQNHVGGGGNAFYPERPVVGGGSSSQANSYSNSASYAGNQGYPTGGPGFSHPFPGGYPSSNSGSFSSSSASSSSNKGGSFSSSASQSGSFSGNARPVRPVAPNVPVTRPDVTPEFSLPDGMCRSSAC